MRQANIQHMPENAEDTADDIRQSVMFLLFSNKNNERKRNN